MAKPQNIPMQGEKQLRPARRELDLETLEAFFPEILVLYLSADGCPLDGNAPAREMLAPFDGGPLLSRIRDRDQEAFRHALRAVSSGENSSAEIFLGLRTQDGALRHLRGWLTPDADSRPGSVKFAAHDVTFLREERERYAEIIEGSIEGIIVHRGSEILYVNQRMAEMVGLDSPEQVMGYDSIAEFLHPDDRERVVANVGARLAGLEAPRDYQFRIQSTAGEALWVDCRAGTVTWGGEPAVVASCFDITEQKLADQARWETEQLFRRVFELSPDILTLSRLEDGRYDFVNPAFLQALGLEMEDVIGSTSADLGIWTATTSREAFIQALRDNEVVNGFEAEVRRGDGATVDVSMSATTLEFRGDEYILMIAHDITEKKRQRLELIESKRAAEIANRTKSEFLANISHELRTPLNAVIGFAELMTAETLGPLGNPQYREYCRDILDAGRHLLSIINDILDLSKLEAGRLTVSPDRVVVSELMTACARLIAERAEAAGLLLEIEQPQEPLEVLADPKRMKQALINLLSNAIKFTPEGGRVRLQADSREGAGVVFTVSDTGIGMTGEEKEKALTPFGQIDSSLARKYEGAGLGLPLVSALVEMQQGRFELESTPGKGTTARIHMPQAGE